MNDEIIVPSRFKLIKRLGQGTFSMAPSSSIGYIYEAFDSKLNKNVALKLEKKDKNKSILKFEYQVLRAL
jgi:hypothetical protein